MSLMILTAPSGSSGGGGGGGGDRLVGDEWFASDLSISPDRGFETYYWDQTADGTEVTRTYNASGGPGNRPYIQETINTGVALSEFGSLSAVTPSLAQTPSHGDNFFIRFSLKLVGHTNQIQKLFQWGFLEGGDRVIFVVQQETSEIWEARIARDGGLWAQTSLSLGIGIWYDIQVEVQLASSSGANNGDARIWVNNDTYASPDAETLNIVDVMSPSGSTGELGWSGYHQGDVNTQLPRTWHWADLRVGPTFDSTWHATGAGA